MKTLILLIAAVASFGLPGSASAQSAAPAPGATTGGLPPYEIMTIVRSTGFEPIGLPLRSGQAYVLRAVDSYDLPVRLVVDARTGRIISAGEAAPRYAGYPPGPFYDPYGAPVYGRIFGRLDDGFGPARPPRGVPAVRPNAAPSAAPLPRPRPYVRDATGSIDTAASHDAAPVQKTPGTANDSAKAGGAALPPVAPLD